MEFVLNPCPLRSSVFGSFGDLVERVKQIGTLAVSAVIGNIFSAILTFCFTLVGTLLGAMTGALIGQEIESGFIRGAAVGAISGAVFSIESAEATLKFGRMGKLGKMLDTFCLSSGSNSCFCLNTMGAEDEFENKPLVASGNDHKLRLKDVVSGKQTLTFQLKPKIVVLRVSMHCHGCARKVEKHISKLEGQTML